MTLDAPTLKTSSKEASKDTYPTGLFYSTGKDDFMTPFVDKMQERVNKRFGCILFVDGILGVGKTTFAYRLARRYNGDDIPAEDFVFLGAANFIDGVLAAKEKKLKAIVYDEAAEFSSGNVNSILNNVLTQVFNVIRQYSLVVILCLPCVFVIDPRIFYTGSVEGLVHVYDRNPNHAAFKVYSQRRLINMFEYKARKQIKVAYNSIYSVQAPNFRGTWKPPPKLEADALAALSKEGKDAHLLTQKEKIKPKKKEIPSDYITQTDLRFLIGQTKSVRADGFKPDIRRGAAGWYSPETVAKIKAFYGVS